MDGDPCSRPFAIKRSLLNVDWSYMNRPKEQLQGEPFRASLSFLSPACDPQASLATGLACIPLEITVSQAMLGTRSRAPCLSRKPLCFWVTHREGHVERDLGTGKASNLCVRTLLTLRRGRVHSRLAGLGSGPCSVLNQPHGAGHFFGTPFLSVKGEAVTRRWGIEAGKEGWSELMGAKVQKS